MHSSNPRRISFCDVLSSTPYLMPSHELFPALHRCGGVEYDKSETLVRKWNLSEVRDQIRLDLESSSITQVLGKAAVIHEHGRRIFFVEPEHSGSATGIKNWFHRFSSSNCWSSFLYLSCPSPNHFGRELLDTRWNYLRIFPPITNDNNLICNFA